MRRMLRIVRPPVFVLLAVCFLAIGRAARAGEYWYVVELEGRRAGHAVVSEQIDGDTIRTHNSMHLSIKRGEIALAISIETQWLETRDGQPVSLVSTTRLGAMPTVKSYRFEADRVALETSTGKQTSRSELKRPEGSWLTPAAAGREVARRLAAGDAEFTIRTLEDDPTGGGLAVMEVTHRVLESAPIEVVGRLVPAIKWRTTIDKFPGIEVTEHVDEHGHALRSETRLGGFTLVQIRADKQLALSPVDAPELLESTLVKPDRRIRNPRNLSAARFVLSMTEGDLPDLPASRVQRIERLDASRVRVTVTTTPSPAQGNDGDLGDGPEFIEPSAMVKSDDPAIAALLKQALPGVVSDPARRAERLRRFVHRFINAKEMSVGFASASEVARTRTGDCTEHAVLLAALLRAAGIPARVASGLVYVEQFGTMNGVFGYHMWTQAWLPGDGPDQPDQWVNLDGTLPEATPFDATHIMLGASALADGQNENFMIALAPLIKRLRISVESTTP